MSEDPVHYRTITVEAEFQLLSNEILKLIARARRQGIEPTDVWLGRREWEIFEAVNTNCYIFAALIVRRSSEDGVRVGATVGS